jgi:hypothetical protein
MKTIQTLFFALSVFCLSSTAFSQSIMWEKNYGGDQYDWGRDILALENGHLIYLCTARSDEHDLSTAGNHALGDFWVVETDDMGNILWSKCYGGTGIEHARSIILDEDGNYVVCGHSASADGDITGNHGVNDSWVIRISPTGALLQERSFGGSGEEYIYDIIETSDGGYAFASGTRSNDGDVSGLHTSPGRQELDFWVVKLDTDFNIEWQRCFGGTEADQAQDIIETPEGDFIVTGWTNSPDGDVTGYHPAVDGGGGGYYDYDAAKISDLWLIRVSNSGDLMWQKTYGGSGYDFGKNLIEDGSGNYMVVGYSSSADYDVNACEYPGVWTLRVDGNGNILKQYCYGESGDYWMAASRTSDGGYIYTMEADENEGVAMCEFGVYDNYWVFKTDAQGRILWQTCVGGNSWDYPYAVEETSDGNFIVIGSIADDGIDINSIYGVKHDIWVVKIANDAPSNSIFINTFPGEALCPGTDIEVPMAAYGVYTTGNVFSVELSDENGTFATPQIIASVSSKKSGAQDIEATLPGDMIPGGDYRIRVTSSNPPTIGSSNQGDITTCPTPATANDMVLSSTSAQLTWSAVNCAESYTISYRPATSPTWLTATSASETLILTGLIPDTKYKWKVRSNCSVTPIDNSPYTAVLESFKTLPLRASEMPANEFSIFPNPATENITVQLNYDSNAQFEIYAADGKLISSGNIDGENNILNISELAAGMYVMFISDNSIVSTHTFVKE